MIKHSLHGILFLFIFVHAFSSYAQEQFRPSLIKQKDVDAQILRVESRLKTDRSNLPKSEPNRSRIIGEYDERATHLVHQLENKELLTDSVWLGWFNGILREIYQGNPGLPKEEMTLLVGRYESANAVNIGEGTIVFNLGLLPHLDNESQVAFILCHEIAHYTNNHSNQFIKEYIQTLYAPETQKQLKNISKSKYDKSARALELLKGMMYNSRRHGRYKELEADSVGLSLLRNTHYQQNAGIEALAILDRIDSVNWPVIPYKKMFEAQAFPFQDSWLSPTPKNPFTAEQTDAPDEWDLDSLKTHPDCKKRMAAIRHQMAGLPAQAGGSTGVQSEHLFTQLKQKSPFEIVEALFERASYGRCLFRTLVLLQTYPEDPYLHSIVAQCIYYIHLNQKNHTLRYVLELPDPGYSDEYNRFLRFFNQFRVTDLGKLGYYYAQKQLEKNPDNEYSLMASALSSLMMNLPDEFNSRKQRFIQSFPNSMFITTLNDIK